MRKIFLSVESVFTPVKTPACASNWNCYTAADISYDAFMALWYPLVACLHALFVGLTFAGFILLIYWGMKLAKKESLEKCIKILLTFGIIGLIATTLVIGWAHSQNEGKDGAFDHAPFERMGGRGMMMNGNRDNKMPAGHMPSVAPAITNSNEPLAPVVNMNTNR